jgi:hypothetical protein
MLSQKFLVDVGIDTFAGKNQSFADLDCRFPVLFRGDGLT